MKVAILNISIGDYAVFWKDFYLSAKQNFMVDCDREFFIFTDKDNIFGNDQDDVHILYQEDMGWPFNTMKRFHMFRSILDQLEGFDYIFFVNGNALFSYPLTSDLITKNLVVVEHPGMHFVSNNDAPYERRKVSRAYVAKGNEKKYVQGAFYGGSYARFSEMVIELDNKTEDDLRRGIIAVWHDESFLNHFVSYHPDIQILGWQYLKYEEYVMPYPPIICLRDKRRYLTPQNGRYKNDHFGVFRMKMVLRNAKWRCFILLKKIKKQRVKDNNGHWIDFDIVA